MSQIVLMPASTNNLQKKEQTASIKTQPCELHCITKYNTLQIDSKTNPTNYHSNLPINNLI